MAMLNNQRVISVLIWAYPPTCIYLVYGILGKMPLLYFLRILYPLKVSDGVHRWTWTMPESLKTRRWRMVHWNVKIPGPRTVSWQRMTKIWCRYDITESGWWYTYPSEKYEFVSWDYEIPNWMESHKIHLIGGFNPTPRKIWLRQIGSSFQLLGKIKAMFQSTNQTNNDP